MPDEEFIPIPEAHFFDCDQEYKVFEFTDMQTLPQDINNAKEPLNVQRRKFEDDSLSSD